MILFWANRQLTASFHLSNTIASSASGSLLLPLDLFDFKETKASNLPISVKTFVGNSLESFSSLDVVPHSGESLLTLSCSLHLQMVNALATTWWNEVQASSSFNNMQSSSVLVRKLAMSFSHSTFSHRYTVASFSGEICRPESAKWPWDLRMVVGAALSRNTASSKNDGCPSKSMYRFLGSLWGPPGLTRPSSWRPEKRKGSLSLGFFSNRKP